MITHIDEATLRMALAGYRQQRAEIEQAISDIEKRLKGNSTPQSAREHRRLSAAGRARIAAAAKKRWAEFYRQRQAEKAAEQGLTSRQIGQRRRQARERTARA